MKDWSEDKQQIITNIMNELNLVGSETEKVFILAEAMNQIDQSKLPPMFRDALDFSR